MYYDWFVREGDNLAINQQQRLVKRFLDITVSLILIGMTWPFMAGVACLIWLEDGSPVLFHQERVGERGHPFTMYKFRTIKQCSRCHQVKEALSLSE